MITTDIYLCFIWGEEAARNPPPTHNQNITMTGMPKAMGVFENMQFAGKGGEGFANMMQMHVSGNEGLMGGKGTSGMSDFGLGSVTKKKT